MNKTKRDLAEAREQLELEKTSNLAYLEAEKAVRLSLLLVLIVFLFLLFTLEMRGKFEPADCPIL